MADDEEFEETAAPVEDQMESIYQRLQVVEHDVEIMANAVQNLIMAIKTLQQNNKSRIIM